MSKSVWKVVFHLQHTCGLVLEWTNSLWFLDLARNKRLCYNYCIQILLFVYVCSGTVWCTFVLWLMVIKIKLSFESHSTHTTHTDIKWWWNLGLWNIKYCQKLNYFLQWQCADRVPYIWYFKAASLLNPFHIRCSMVIYTMPYNVLA